MRTSEAAILYIGCMGTHSYSVRHNKTGKPGSNTFIPDHSKKFLQLSARPLLCWICAGWLAAGLTAQTRPAMELSRPVRSGEFLCAMGQRSAILGNESGNVEAWVYPMKLLRDFSLVFHVEGHAIPAAAVARTVIVRPESESIRYASDTFQVTETFLAPVQEPGAIVRLEVETEEPLEIEVVFHRDFQLEWPAGMDATFSSWDAANHAFAFEEEERKFAGLVGSPTGTLSEEEFDSNYISSAWSGIRLGTTAKGKETKFIVIAASSDGFAEAQATYKKLTEQHEQLEKESAEYYAKYLERTTSVEVPDEELQRGYDWSRVSVAQGIVASAKFGKGLIAGYGPSGESYRPGYDWFFGRDALWTALALDSEGDFETARMALEFLTQFQREDGRVPHEISQTAYMMDWFKQFPYGFASADATALYVIGIEDYVRASGDIAFAQEHWNNAKKAWEFLRLTYGPAGLPKNFGVGHGWVEGGPLLPVQSELYQSGIAAEAVRRLAELAKRTGHEDEAKNLDEEASGLRVKVDRLFWSEEKQYYGFAVDQESKLVPVPTVLATVPMWFEVLDAAHAKKTIAELASLDHATDWGMRIISDKSPLYSAGGYHYGSVWPLFTGWAAVGEYNYHQEQAAWQNLRANALLALDGSPGHVTEVLSGTYYQGLSTASPHQIWSAAMVVAPVLQGLFGLKVDATTHTLRLAPTLPANWNSFALKNVRMGSAAADFKFQRTEQEMTLEVQRSGEGQLALAFEPTLSLRAQVISVSLNAKPITFRVQPNESDQQLQARFSVAGPCVLRVRVKNDFAVSYTPRLPTPGARSEGLRIVSEEWSNTRDQLTLQVEGSPGKRYELELFGGKQVGKVEGGELLKDKILVTIAASEALAVKQQVVVHFATSAAKGKH
jgi:glycogen debranching enzyme